MVLVVKDVQQIASIFGQAQSQDPPPPYRQFQDVHFESLLGLFVVPNSNCEKNPQKAWGGGGRGDGKIDEIKKKPKSTLLAENTRGLITTKQTKLRPVASAAPHPKKLMIYVG